MRAMISVSDKTGVVAFARALAALGCEVVSTGGTYQALRDAGVPVVGISEVTGFPECLDGRVKTLHPAVHGGILAMRGEEGHMAQIAELGIAPIDIVAINLYPFRETILREDVTLPLAIENIDIGGPAMLRSAAKNHRDVIALCDPADYDAVISGLRTEQGVSYEAKYRLALKVFEHTAAYDAMIAEYLRAAKNIPLPDNPTFTYEKIQDLRYGENPHQKAAYYRETRPRKGALVNAAQLHGKELSFNNIGDANGALACLREFSAPAVVAVKHANPCGVGTADNIAAAWQKAYEADPVSIFGGVVAANRPVDRETAERIGKIFVEIVIAPGFSDEALEILKRKQNIRLLTLGGLGKQTPSAGGIDEAGLDASIAADFDAIPATGFDASPAAGLDARPAASHAVGLDFKKVDGGILVQDADATLFDEAELRVVTKRQPTPAQLEDMKFAMKVVKHVKSNAIVVAADGMTLGIGPGQTNRIGAARIAIAGPDFAGASPEATPATGNPHEAALAVPKAGISPEGAATVPKTEFSPETADPAADSQAGRRSLEGAVLASDAFFPFADCVDAAASAGITAIIQPGGSIRDEDSIKKCDALGIAMVFSGTRHFKH